MPKEDPSAAYRELRDTIDEAVQQNGRNRAHRRVLRTLIREELADRLELGRQESRRLPRGKRPRCGARTRKDTACVRPALANGRCPNHGGLSTGPRTKAGRKRIAAAQRKRWAEWRRIVSELK
jgi:hypothetical protein